MSEEIRTEATLLVLRALASDESVNALDGYRMVPGSNVVSRAEARKLIARMPKPISCTSKLENDTLVLDCQHLSERYQATGVVNAWQRFKQNELEDLTRRLADRTSEFDGTTVIQILGGLESIKLEFDQYCIWFLEYDFPTAYVREEYPLATEANYDLAVTKRYQASSGPAIEGSIRFSSPLR